MPSPRTFRFPKIRCITFGPLAKSLGIGAITQRQAAYVAALMYGTGAGLVFASVALPHDHSMNQPVVLAVAIVAAATASLFATVGPRMAPCRFYVADLAGTFLISLLVAFGGTDSTAYAMLYVWAAIYVFYFFGIRYAIGAAGWIAVSAAVAELLSHPLTENPGSITSWMMAIGTAAVAGLVIQDLMRRLLQTISLDPLTKAANRNTWVTETTRAVALARRQKLPLTVLLADLDHFKIYNDDYGHQAGDALLVETVSAWQKVVREFDVVARYGGEEFAILLMGCTAEAGQHMAERLRQVVPKGQTVSIGVAQLEKEDDATTIVARADAALYQAKARGRNRTELAGSEADADGLVAEVSRWATVVMRVLEAGSIGVAFQPIVDLNSAQTLGAEALARPLDSTLSVEGLFTIAQRMGRSSDMDWACRRSAIRAASQRPRDGALFINVSVASLLEDPKSADRMCDLAAEFGLQPADIVLEVTERENVTNMTQLVRALEDHRERGFRVAVDDVGEGHSTLELLAAVVPDYIKLAGSLVRRIEEPGGRAAIGAAITFAELSGTMIIAEGIEDPLTAEALRASGAQFGQGYHFGRPTLPGTIRASETILLTAV